jgi:cystathionine beta-lyase
MEYNFDEVIDRRDTDSVKWDHARDVFGRDVLPMWVADMDFKSPKPVIDAIVKHANYGVYGYTYRPGRLNEAIADWMQRRHGWKIEKDWIFYMPGVVPSINTAVQAFTKEGDSVIIQTPVYHPFFVAVKYNGRRLLRNPLKQMDGQYLMDYEDLKDKLDMGAKMAILCSPHNPGGRVWKAEELERFGKLCKSKDAVIVSDEIHSDIVYNGNKHIPIASISSELSERSITCIAPSKTFNIAGLSASAVIIPDETLRRRFADTFKKTGINTGNLFGIEAMEVAYTHGEEWLEKLLVYLEGNISFIDDYLKKNIPDLKLFRPQGTYLAWIDCRRLGLKQSMLEKFFVKKAGIGLTSGTDFGEEGEGFMRLNFGCPRSILEEGLNRIDKAVKSLQSR